MKTIKLVSVTKRYGSKTILENFSLEIEKGEFVALVGNSGCGKSTLLNIIGLLEDFEEGDLIIEDMNNIIPDSSMANKFLREKIGYLFQNFALVDDETVEYNISLALKYVRANKKEKQVNIHKALEKVGLQGYQKRKVYELSGGEQQRVALARIFVKPCSIILADEPTGSLDEKNRDIVLNLLKQLNESGKTVLLVTHDKYVASQCDRIVNM